MTYVSREQMAKMAGLVDVPDVYTPATVGKMNKVVMGNNVMAPIFCDLNFTDSAELRALTPETVSARPLAYTDELGGSVDIKTRMAIVGDQTHRPYAIHSDRYNILQHRVIVEAMAEAADDAGLSVFGHTSVSGGRFNGYATFANPDVHMVLGDRYEDPIMLGMRFYNSHLGDTGFGGEIFGIRHVCGNMCAFGKTLGSISAKHFTSMSKTSTMLASILEGFIDNIPRLKDRMTAVRNTAVDAAEAEDLLWGIRYAPLQIESIMTHLTELNPEIKPTAISAFDIYNATTAYVSYRVGGSHMENSNLSLLERSEDLLTANIDVLIEKGAAAKQKYAEEMAHTSMVGPITVRTVA